MRVGVCVDGDNLYYGARDCCGGGTPGWRWLDVRSLIESVISTQGAWASAVIDRLVYCTARVDAVTDPSAAADQEVYLRALTGSVDRIEYGRYVTRARTALLAAEDPHTGRPVPLTSRWPLMVQDRTGAEVREARFMIRYLHLEEKGSDVNLISHILLDLTDAVDGVVVVSNDSDLEFPIRTVRTLIPTGVVNPRNQRPTGALRGEKWHGVGNHWWWRLNADLHAAHQLPNPVRGYTKPVDW